jgi:hypothetical protein
MNARSLLSRRQENKDFRRRNLRGQSFRGQDLSGIDFTGSDIRGADFTYAILKGANLTGVRTGLPPLQQGMVFIASVAASLMLGAFAGFIEALVELEFHNTNGFGGLAPTINAKWIVLAILLAFGFVAQRNGLTRGFGVFVFALVLAGIGAFASSVVVPIAAAVAIAITVVGFFLVVSGVVVILALTTALATNLTLGSIVVAAFAPIFTLVAVPTAAESAVAVAIVVTLISAYIVWRSFYGDARHAVMRGTAEGLAMRLSTTFRGADLTQADFSQAQIQMTNFSDATFNQTRMSH